MTLLTTLLADTSTSIIGEIKRPDALEPYGDNGGLITFGSNLLVLVITIGGIIALFNIIFAGYTYLTATDSKAHEKVLNKLNMSFIGMLLMIGAPAIMAIAGWVFFKQPMFFLRPKIQGPTTTSTSTGGYTNNVTRPDREGNRDR